MRPSVRRSDHRSRPPRRSRRPAAAGAMLALATTAVLAAPPVSTGAAEAAVATATPVGTATSSVVPEVPVDASGTTIGAISDVVQDAEQVTLQAADGAARVTFLDEATVRVESDPSGSFTDPANTPEGDPARTADIVVGRDEFPGVEPTVTEADGEITLSTDAVALTVDADTSRMTLHRADGSVVWEESAPVTFGADSATQHLATQDGEQFLGGGMQNGRSIHTGETVNVARNFDWNDDGYPNAVPYYMTSAGYGVLRNTFARGSYTFTADATTTHEERRFDAYYFVGDYKESLDGYTALTGRPLMPPVYALEYGDADCYNRSNPDYSPTGGDPEGIKQTTPQAAITAARFKENDMPGGWMLVNDGYGCEYTELPETVAQIAEEADLVTGLWTERSLTNQEYEVAEAGIRLRKLDVAWVGSGYRQALTACESAHSGIEEFSDARGTSLMVEGWAGSQRCGMQWTGDHAGNLDAVRWQVSALTGAGNSGLPFTTGDVDGIFGGSPESYVRDLQWKAFAPALYSMSGWAAVDKRPWLYGDEATKINRDYLQLRQRLMPYIYTLAAQAHSQGTPPMRSVALEYPDDPMAYGEEANTEFLLGTDFLVAPVYTDSDVRDGIYLPEGQWVDYWTGRLYDGGRVLDGYDAPLDTLPVFVRAGAIVPQGMVARNASLVPEDSTITLDVYPQGESTFELYEDDKVTREYADGRSARQSFTVEAPDRDGGDVSIAIGSRDGGYTGMAEERPYALDVHTGSAPEAVVLDGTDLAEVADAAALSEAATGWFFDEERGGVVRVKVGTLAADASANLVLRGTSAVGGLDSDGQRVSLEVEAPGQVFPGESAEVEMTFTNTGTKVKTDLEIAAELPEGWTTDDVQGSTAAAVAPGDSVTATFVVTPGSGAKAGAATVRGAAAYLDSAGGERSVSGGQQVDVVFANLADAFNRVSITSLETKDTGNFDGSGASFSETALADAGATWGEPVSVTRGDDTFDMVWPDAAPGVANSTSLAGQTVAVSGSGTHLAFLGSGASGGGVTPEVTITYADGTTAERSFFLPNWLLQGDRRDAVDAVESKGRNNAANPDGYEYPSYTYRVYANVVALDPSKELRSITFSQTDRAILFDMRPVDLTLPEAPSGDVWLSDLPWVSASNGYGVIGIDVANKDNASSPDKPLVINTTDELKETYDKGLGVHAPSRITYYLGGECTRFTSDAGLEDGFSGSVIFSVDVDDVSRYEGTTFQPGFPTEEIDLDLTGAQYLELAVSTPGTSINGAHGVWGGPRLECDEDAPELAFSTDVRLRTIGSSTVLAVRVVNDEGVPVDVTIETPYGDKSFSQVEPGQSAYQAFSTRSDAVDAGEVLVTVTGTIDGKEVTATRAVPYPVG
ncbi:MULTISPECIES: NPCBM/NEW2 domain-containing protein [unclassified Isoptericola]|uniref:NPCBM/NEW2 domain-containing protein n=1 Tax=unclassified Isoptericola TaxID=2623355 RepID=UPI002712F368|nr:MULTISPECIES: NPCBM/NEW2 domain-containing protein [unclassified Isoptericola]MDO8145625.1 glycoside hydrolase family 31 protein [Isoptericola sp. 178]MDO8149179.1 glycoside hydrolase family 31 protein [Isoptericola sp. b515]